MDLAEAAGKVLAFEGGDLTGRITSLECLFRRQGQDSARLLCEVNGIVPSLIQAARTLKAVSGQINTLIHAAGILTALPHILQDDEQVQELSLGAGNTGRAFDLETTRRIAEFKFITWRGGSETVRQNSVFKDFFRLAEAESVKDRYLYLLELDRPSRFFNGRRALSSILSRDTTLRREFREFTARHGEQFVVVRDYYLYRQDRVQLCDLSALVPGFAALGKETVARSVSALR